MEVSPLKYTRAYFGDSAEGMSDADMVREYIQQKQIDPSMDLGEVINQMELTGKSKLAETVQNSQLKATRRALGDQVLGMSDEQLLGAFIEDKNIGNDVPLSEVFKMMETGAGRVTYDQDIKSEGDQVGSIYQLGDAVATAKDLLGAKGQSLLTAKDISSAVDVQRIDRFLKPEGTQDGFVATVAKEASAFGIPFFTKVGKRLGQVLANGGENSDRMRDLDKIENTLNDPDAITRFVAEVNRFKESPELFSDDEKETLRQAALAFETTGNFFKTETGATFDFATSALESAVLPVVKGLSQVAGSVGAQFGYDREFSDDVLRSLNFTDQVLADQDDESVASIAGSMLGSVGQTMLAVYTGMGPAGLFALYGTQGASDNIEKYREFVRERGLDPSLGEEAFLALGGMLVSGGLASALTGKVIEDIPGIKNLTAESRKLLFQRAIEGGMLKGMTADGLKIKGMQAVKNILAKPEILKNVAKAYGKFAASAAPVEAFEEMSEDGLNELLFQFANENYETDPIEFMKSLALSGLGGAIGGAAIGPAVKKRYSDQAMFTSNNVMGLDHMAAATPKEAREKLKILEDRADTIRALYGRVPAPIMEKYADMRNKLSGVAGGELTASEAFTPEQLMAGTGNIMSIGEIANSPDLRNTALGLAATEATSKKAEGIAPAQRSVYQKLIEYFQNSDLASENPELVEKIINRIYMTPLSTGKGKRVAATTSVMNPDEKGRFGRQFRGTYLTNGVDETAMHDEIFHILNDSKTSAEQDEIVAAYNSIYGTNYTSYSDPEARDAIAKKAAAIATGRAKHRTADVSNKFYQIVESQINGEILAVNPGFSVNTGPIESAVAAEIGKDDIVVTQQQMMDAIRTGQLRRVTDPELQQAGSPYKGMMTLQDNSGTVFTYRSIVDSEGNETGVITPIKVSSILPTDGPNMVTTVVNPRDNRPVEEIRHEAMLKDMVKDKIDGAEEALAANNRLPVVRQNMQVAVPPTITGEWFVEDVPQGGPDQTRDGFFVDQNGNIVQFVDGEPTVGFDLVMTVDENGQTVQTLRPRPINKTEVQTEYEQGRLLKAAPEKVRALLGGYTGPERQLPRGLDESEYDVITETPLPENGFFIDPVGNIIEVRDGEPIQAVRLVTVTNNEGQAFNIFQPVKADLGELKALYDGNKLIAVNYIDTKRQLRPGDRMKTLLTKKLAGSPGGSANWTTQDALDYRESAKRGHIPQEIADLIEESAEKAQREEEDRKALAEEKGEPIYDVGEPTVAEPAETVAATPLVTDTITDDVWSKVPEANRKHVAGLMTGDVAKVKGMKNTTEVDAITGFPLIEISNEKLYDTLKNLGLIVPGNILIGDTVTPTIETVVSFNPNVLNTAVIESLEAEVQSDISDKTATEAVVSLIVPKKGKGAKGGKITFVYAVDEAGEKVIFPSVTAARNYYENYYTTTSEQTGDGLFVGPHFFTFENGSTDVKTLMEEQLGEHAARIGRALLTADEKTKEELGKAIMKFGKQLLNKATGSTLYNEENFQAARRNLISLVADVAQPTIEAATDVQLEPVENVPEVDLASKESRKRINDMRRSARRKSSDGNMALRPVANATGMFQFVTEKPNSVAVFSRNAEALGATGLITEEKVINGKKVFVVTGVFNPNVAASIFGSDPEMYKLLADPIVVEPVEEVVEKAPVTEDSPEVEVEIVSPETFSIKAVTKLAKKAKEKIKEVRDNVIMRETPDDVKDRMERRRLKKEQIRIEKEREQKAKLEAEKKRLKTIQDSKVGMEKVKRETMNNFLEMYENEESFETVHSSGVKNGKNVRISTLILNGEKVGEIVSYDATAVDHFFISSDFVQPRISGEEADQPTTSTDLANGLWDAVFFSTAGKTKLGYARPIFSKSIGERERALVEEYSATFKPQTPIVVMDVKDADLIQAYINSHSPTMAKSLARSFNAARESRGRHIKIHATDHTSHTIIIINPDLINSELDGVNANPKIRQTKVIETLSHELGHALFFDTLETNGPEFHAELEAAYKEAYEKMANQDIATVFSEFLEPGVAYFQLKALLEAANGDEEAVVSLNGSDLLKLIPNSNYLFSYKEWTARQFAKWVSSGAKVSPKNSNIISKGFQKIADALKTFFEKFKSAGHFEPNSQYEEWLNKVIETRNSGMFDNEVVSRVGFSGNISEEDADHLSLVDYHMSSEEITARNDNMAEAVNRDKLVELRGQVENWKDVERQVTEGKVMEGATDMEKEYAEFFKAARQFVNRPAPPEGVPMDVMVSYATAASPFPAAVAERAELVVQRFRNSFINDARRRLLSPIITRMQMVAKDHPEIAELAQIVARTTSVPGGMQTAEIPYTDSLIREIGRRTSTMTKAMDPIFKHFGYNRSTAQKATAAIRHRGDITKMMNTVFMGVRDKNSVDLDMEFDGVRLEQIIDDVRVALDELFYYAKDNGLVNDEDFVKFKDEIAEHYVPRVYNREVVLENIDHFREHIVARNLQRVYKIAKNVDEKAAAKKKATGEELTYEEERRYSRIEDIPDSILNENDLNNIARISEAITNNIAYGRSFTMASVFNPDYQPGKSMADVIEHYGQGVPDRLKKRQLWFIPDAELLGQVEINGKKIPFLDTNMIHVMTRSIESVVKRVEFAKAYGKRGELFAAAEEKLRAKILNSTSDPRTVNKIKRDLDALRGMFESVAEIVDGSRVGTRRFLNEAPIRSVVSGFSKVATMGVMGLSSFLALAETGNMFIRTGLKGGIIGLAKFLEIAGKKTFKWPAAALGLGENYSDVLEEELVALGYLHEIGEDVSSRARFDPFFNEDGDFTGGTTLAGVSNALTFAEDAFYRVTMLEQITRVSQIAAAHASNVIIRGLADTVSSGKELKPAQKRDLVRLGFVDGKGNLDMEAVRNYVDFFTDLELARRSGTETLEAFAKDNKEMFDGAHYRVMSRMINQQITRPNVATRTVWGNSKNPLVRAAYRLRSFTHGYRALIANFMGDEFKNLYQDKDAAGLAMFAARFIPLLMMAFMTIAAREEFKADIHEMSGNTTQAETIRTRYANRTTAGMILDVFDKSGLTLQASDFINAVEGAKYGNGLFSAVYGVTASRAERLYDDALRSGLSGDPAFVWNSMLNQAPGANTGAFDFMKLQAGRSNAEYDSDADFYGFNEADWQ